MIFTSMGERFAVYRECLYREAEADLWVPAFWWAERSPSGD